eukprot:s3968_g13.t1
MWPVATAPTSLPKPAPAGSVEVRCPRQTSFPGNCLQGKYLFAMYPHGVYGVCRAFSGIREMSLFSGCLDASKPILERAISRGWVLLICENLMLLPGGIDEMNLTDLPMVSPRRPSW